MRGTTARVKRLYNNLAHGYLRITVYRIARKSFTLVPTQKRVRLQGTRKVNTKTHVRFSYFTLYLSWHCGVVINLLR